MLLRLSTTLSVLVLALTVGVGPGQQTAPQTKDSQEETVFHSSARLVQVSVVVEDKKGNPVTGLKKEDFTVMDDGKPQPKPLCPFAGVVFKLVKLFEDRAEFGFRDAGAGVPDFDA